MALALGLVPLLWPGPGLILLPVPIALLHLVIDPACTVVFEALPGAPELMQQPPRPPSAPLFGPATWRRALSQGAVVMLAALALAFWPNSPLELRRSLVFSLLLLTSGSLVWLNGDRASRLSATGAALGVGLWLALLTIPGLMPLLSLAPLQTPQVLTVVAGAVITTLLAALVTRRPA